MGWARWPVEEDGTRFLKRLNRRLRDPRKRRKRSNCPSWHNPESVTIMAPNQATIAAELPFRHAVIHRSCPNWHQRLPDRLSVNGEEVQKKLLAAYHFFVLFRHGEL
jgi:hypothetical protein